MILILKHDLDMVKIYLYAENELPSYGSSKVRARTNRQTHLTEIITYALSAYVDGKKRLLHVSKNLCRHSGSMTLIILHSNCFDLNVHALK